MTWRLAALPALLCVLAPLASHAAGRCPEVLAALGDRVADAACFERFQRD